MLKIIFAVMTALLLVSCTKPSTVKYACATPMGYIEINEETDNHIYVKNNLLHASRENKSITIPFSQCVAVTFN